MVNITSTFINYKLWETIKIQLYGRKELKNCTGRLSGNNLKSANACTEKRFGRDFSCAFFLHSLFLSLPISFFIPLYLSLSFTFHLSSTQSHFDVFFAYFLIRLFSILSGSSLWAHFVCELTKRMADASFHEWHSTIRESSYWKWQCRQANQRLQSALSVRVHHFD